MNPFSSFLDTASPSLSNMPRSVGGPLQSPNPHGNSNGTPITGAPPSSLAGPAGIGLSHVGGGAGGPPGQPGAANMPLVNGFPSGGQQTDMNYLWGMVQQLSQLLEENRAQTQGIVNGVQAIQQRAAEQEDEGLAGLSLREVNGELSAANQASQILHLTSQLNSAQTTISNLTETTQSLQLLLLDYESALTLLLEKLRPFAFQHTQANLALHKHYQSALETERAISMQLRLEHAEWQAGLGRVAEYARLALKTQAEAELPYQRELRSLREENRVLRRLAGWEERKYPGDESDEEDRNGNRGEDGGGAADAQRDGGRSRMGQGQGQGQGHGNGNGLGMQQQYQQEQQQ